MKALDAPSTLSYAQDADRDSDADLSPPFKSRIRGPVDGDEVTEARIKFSAEGLVQTSGPHSQPYLVLVQNDREIGRTEAVGAFENVTWGPAQVAFGDAWMPVSVQVSVRASWIRMNLHIDGCRDIGVRCRMTMRTAYSSPPTPST